MTNKVRVLAVDDTAENLAALTELLQTEEVEIVKAGSGAEALETLLVEDVALALLDVQMPEMDGFELAQLMRGIERTRRIPIIFLTAVATDDRRRFRGYETGAVDYLLKPIDPDIVRSKVAVFVELYRQRVELAKERDAHAKALTKLQAHIDNSLMACIELDSERRVTAWSKGAERMFGRSSDAVLGLELERIGLLAEDGATEFCSFIDGLFAATEDRATCCVTVLGPEGKPIDCECYCSALGDPAKRCSSVTIHMLDVTARKRAEETQHLLVGELNHRVKNNLALVQAIAHQTLSRCTEPEQFVAAFQGRLQALAKAHSLLSKSTWQAVSLHDIIASQTEIGSFDPNRLVASGPGIQLQPEAALHLSMVLHELVTNAHKYGALSGEVGTVSLSWHQANNWLHLDWAESGGPAAAQQAGKGFGTSMIERSLRAYGGDASIDYATAGIAWHIRLPLSLCTFTGSSAQGDPRKMATVEDVQASGKSLAGRKVLIVEDEPLLGMQLLSLLEDAGIEVTGPVADVQSALACLTTGTWDCALLDCNLRGQRSDAVAEALLDRKIPFAFVSGYGREHLTSAHAAIPLVSKPYIASEIIGMCNELTG